MFEPSTQAATHPASAVGRENVHRKSSMNSAHWLQPRLFGDRDQVRRCDQSAGNTQDACRAKLYAFLAATNSSMRAHKFCMTKYWSVVALPSFTSWVHCSIGILMPNVLSIAKAMSRKSRLSIPRSLMAWLSSLIVSRGISQVSVIMFTTVSNVEDIAKY